MDIIDWCSIRFVEEHLYELISLINGRVQITFLNGDGSIPQSITYNNTTNASFLHLLFIKPHTVDIITQVNGDVLTLETLTVSCPYLSELWNTLHLLLQRLLREEIKLTINYANNMEVYVKEVRANSFLRFLRDSGNTHQSLRLSSLIHLRDIILEDKTLMQKVPPKYAHILHDMVASKSKLLLANRPITGVHRCGMCSASPCSHKTLRLIQYNSNLKISLFK